MSPTNKPVYYLENGKTLTVETDDALSGQVYSDCSIEKISNDSEYVNPATGPIYVYDASPGDILCVEILKIKTKGIGYLSPGNWAIRDKNNQKYEFFDCNKSTVNYKGVELILKPNIGVIGVSPKKNKISNKLQGSFGGNMDTSIIRTGTKVYLPVKVPGALLSLGDVHALMADGEANGQGIECASEIDIRTSITPDIKCDNPIVETDTVWAVIASAKTLDDAVRIACNDMLTFICSQTKLDNSEASILMGLITDIKICQVVNENKTVRIEIEKKYLNKVSK